MKREAKILIMLSMATLLSGMLLIGNVSALDFDNSKTYDSVKREATIKNAFGLGAEIAKIRLASELDVKVIPGKDRLVAEFDIINNEDYLNVFKAMEFFNVKDGNKEISRQFVYKYRVQTGTREVPTYSNCKDNGKAEATCDKNTISEPIYEWKNIDSNLQAGQYHVGIFTEVFAGETIEWIPTLFGVRISEWATWTGYQNNDDKIIYYRLSQGSGTAVNNAVANQPNGTYNSAPVWEASSFTGYGNASRHIASRTLNTTYAMAIENNFTIEWRMNASVLSGTLISTGDDTTAGWAMAYDGAFSLSLFIAGCGQTNGHGFVFTANQTHHLAMVKNATTWTFYEDGVLRDITTCTATSFAAEHLYFGKDTLGQFGGNFYIGQFDQIILWNKTLTAAEILSANNSDGDGETQASYPIEINVTLNSPANNTIRTVRDILLSGTATPRYANLTNITFRSWYVNSSAFNTSVHAYTGAANVSQTQTLNLTGLGDGRYLWGIEACALNGTGVFCNKTIDNRTFTIDATAPVINLSTPRGLVQYHESGSNLTISWTVTDAVAGLSACWISYNNVNTSVPCAANIFAVNITSSTPASLIFYANDTANNLASNSTNWIYWIFENSRILNATTFDTAYETIAINSTFNSTYWSSLSSVLVYNGTRYSTTASGSGDARIFSTAFDIPIVLNNQNKSYYWEFGLVNSSGTFLLNSTTGIQEVRPSDFTFCDGVVSTRAVNYSIYDEITIANRINVTNFDATFQWYLGSGNIKKNATSALTNVVQAQYCINPTTRVFNVDADIDLRANGYNQRIFNLRNQHYSSTITEQSLYMLNSSVASEIIIKVQDSGLAPLPGLITKISRYYPGTDSYLVVEQQKTDHFGQFVADLVENDVRYKFQFYNATNDLIATAPDVVIACYSTICVIPFTIGDATDDFARFTNVTGFVPSLTFNNNTNTFIYSWTESPSSGTVKRLYVERRAFNGTAIVCNSTSISDSSSLTCAVGNAAASYTASVYYGNRRIDTLSANVGADYQIFGREGLFLSFILLMTMITVGVFKPPVGILLFLVGFFIMGVSRVILINPMIMIAEFVIGVLFIWALRS